MHEAAALDEEILRISLDAKATIKLGMFSRKGRSRVEIKALDHDFSKEKVHLFGLFFGCGSFEVRGHPAARRWVNSVSA